VLFYLVDDESEYLTRCAEFYPYQACEVSQAGVIVESQHSVCALLWNARSRWDGDFDDGRFRSAFALDSLAITNGAVLELGGGNVKVRVVVVLPDPDGAGGVYDGGFVEDDADTARRGDDLVGTILEKMGSEFSEAVGDGVLADVAMIERDENYEGKGKVEEHRKDDDCFL
jgi:hypothetical protein